MDLYSANSFLDMESMLFWSLSPEPFDLVPTISDVVLPPEERRSAFITYTRPAAECSSSHIPGNKPNIHNRVIDLLRRMPRPKPEEATGPKEGSRGFRHMMRERQRREKMSQSYQDLYNMLPCGSKGDKNSIIQSAAAYLKGLKGAKEELVRHSGELRKRAERESDAEGTKINIRLGNATSNVDSMIGALRSLKAMDAKARAICYESSGHEMTVVMSIETKVGATEVERAVECSLMESWR